MLRKLTFLVSIVLILSTGFHISRAQWVSMDGPRGGWISQLVVKDTSLFVVVNTIGLFRTSDNGVGWDERLPMKDLISIAVSGNNLVAGSLQHGVIVSKDEGVSWSVPTLPFVITQLWTVENGDTVVYAETSVGSYRSTDCGETWEKRSNTPPQRAVRLGSTLYGVDGVAFFVSKDNGVNWKVVEGAWSQANASGIAVHNHDLIVSSEAGIFRSSDSGATWIPLNEGLTDLTVDAMEVDGDTIYAGTHFAGLFRSTNYCLSWCPLNDGLTSKTIVGFAVCRNRHFLATMGSGVFRLDTQGNSWEPANQGLPLMLTRAFCATPSGLFLATYDQGLYSTTNSGANWLPSVNGLTDFVVFGLASLGKRIFADTRDSGSFVSSDNGATWTPVDIGPPSFTRVYASIVVTGSNVAFALSKQGLSVSRDGGISWLQADSGLTGRHVLAVVTLGPWMYAATQDSELFASRDTGVSWRRVSEALPMNRFSVLAACGSSLFAASDSNLFRSSDSGKTWVPIIIGLANSYITTLVVWRGNLFTSAVGSNQGIFLSTNCGDSWIRVGEGLAGNVVVQLAVEGDDIFAATGAGVWRRPLSEMITSVSPTSENIPSRFSLLQNYPNPFNATTVVSGQWTVDSRVRLIVYDVLGRELAVIADGRYPAGKYSFTFDGSNLSSGMYFYRLTAGSCKAVRKMTLIK